MPVSERQAGPCPPQIGSRHSPELVSGLCGRPNGKDDVDLQAAGIVGGSVRVLPVIAGRAHDQHSPG